MLTDSNDDSHSATEAAKEDEDERRRWFYSECLTIMLSCSDKARNMKISNMFAQVRQDRVPIEKWVHWIKSQLMLTDGEDDSAN